MTVPVHVLKYTFATYSTHMAYGTSQVIKLLTAVPMLGWTCEGRRSNWQTRMGGDGTSDTCLRAYRNTADLDVLEEYVVHYVWLCNGDISSARCI